MSKYLSISLGASICPKNGSFDPAAIRAISSQLHTLASKGFKVAAVAGVGGAGALPIKVASKYAGGRDLDEIKINVSRINALLLIASLRVRESKVIPYALDTPKYLEEIRGGCIGVFGGLKPGLTSDSSAALIAKKLRCPLIIVSTKGAIYEKDPELARSSALKKVDRKYLKNLMKERLAGHILDRQTCRILLQMPRGSRAAVTGFRNIALLAQSWDKTSAKNTKIIL
ncbi:MAG: amino acid kinase family protein [Nitrososphaerales archaeon]